MDNSQHVPTDQAAPERVRHKKRGTEYDVVGRGLLQTDTPLSDYTEVVAYRGDDGDVWVRPVIEFEDGRFEVLARRADLAAPSAPAEVEGLVLDLLKRADTLGIMLTDPPKPYPTATALRKAATALTAQQAKIARLTAEVELQTAMLLDAYGDSTVLDQIIKQAVDAETRACIEEVCKADSAELAVYGTTYIQDRLTDRLAAIQPDPEPQPVAWQRNHPQRGWIDVHQEDIEHYRSVGQVIRPLFASPSSAGMVSVEAAARVIVEAWDADTLPVNDPHPMLPAFIAALRALAGE